MSIYDKSGFGEYAPPVGSALAGGGKAGLLTGIGGIVSGVAPLLGVAGGLSDMFGGGKTDISKAVSGGTFMTGEFSTGKAQSTLIIIAAVVLGLFIIFRGKK